jgi:hypothetical protein
MKKNFKKILVITAIIIIYSLLKMFLFNDDFTLFNFLSNFTFFLIFSFLIALIWSFFRFKRWGLIKVFYRSTFLALILITIILSVGRYYETANENIKNDKEKYKKIVNKENDKPIKKVGDIKKEFLNEDNFYENYVYNYAVKFPSNYTLNYGIGEYSNILAYNENNGKQISITTGDNKLGYSFSNQKANEMIDSFDKEQLNFFTNGIIKKWKKEGSYQSVKIINEKVVNFYNKKFIKLTFEATRNLNDIDYIYTVTDYITFFKENNHHFYFESPKPQNETEWEEWENLILETMSKVRISNTITQ